MNLPVQHRVESTLRVQLPRTIGIAMVAAFSLIFAGCSATGSGEGRAGAGGAVSGGSSGTTADPAVMARVEREHVIGPNAARELNYRVAWQYIGGDRDVKIFRVEGDSVFVLDGRNYLTRIKIQDGMRLWRMQVSEPIDLIVGLNFTGDRVFITTGGAVLVLDAGTGSQIAKQPIQQIANTQPTVYGDYLIYGSRNGQVVWHTGSIGYQWKGYQIANAINVPPVVEDNLVTAVGNDGEVIVLTVSDARQLWSKKLLAPVVAAPAVGNSAVFVAGQDQYIAAYDIDSGRVLWRVLRESPMTDSPTLVGDRLYQRVPRHGLFCYVAVPVDKPGGELIWNAANVDGNVIFERRSQLFVWNSQARKLMLVEPNRGAIVKTLDLPSAEQIRIGGELHNEIYAISDDGRVVRLVPRN